MRETKTLIDADDLKAVLEAYIDEYSVYATMLSDRQVGAHAKGEVSGLRRAVTAIERLAVREIR